MTIDNQVNKNQYTADGVNIAFSYGFKINASNEVIVIVTDTAGADVTKVETTDYTVSGVGNNGGGNINFVTAPTNLHTVTLIRNVPLTQATDYIDNASFAAAGHEDGLDKTIMIAQRQQEEIDRGIKVRPSSDVNFSPEINLTGGASKFLRINSSGTAIELADATVSAGSGLASVDGVSNAGGNVDFKSLDGTVTITPNDTNNDIDFSASASQPFATLAGVSNSGGDVSVAAGTAMIVTPNDTTNTITVSFDPANVAVNSLSGNTIDGGVISDFQSTGIDDNATNIKLSITDSNTEVTNDLTLKEATPLLNFEDTNGVADEKVWRWLGDAGIMSIEALTDAFATGNIALRILRTGTTIDEVELNAALIDINGNVDMSGTVDCSGTESIKVPVGTTAQRPVTPTNGDTRYNTTTGKLESYINGSWQDIATGTGSGETNLTANVGVGTGNIFRDKTGVTANLKTLIGGTNITVTDNANDITITAAGTVGESNTASNVGGKTGTVFKQKTGVDLEFKTLSAGSGLTLTNNASDIDISLASTSIFDVTTHGATGDGVTDDTSAINTAITALLAGTSGGILYFPGGEYKITSKLTITLGSVDESIIIKGDGEELTQLSFTGAIDGIDIVLNSTSGSFDSDKSAAIVQDLSMETDTAGGQVGLKFSAPAGTSLAPLKRVTNVSFSGNSPSTYWGTALNFDECTFTETTGCNFNSKSPEPYAGTGILFSGVGTVSPLVHPVDHHVSRCKWLAMAVGISITENVEGVYIDQVTMVAVGTGIFWNQTGALPLLSVTGSHINASEKCIDLNGVTQFLISGNLLYAHDATGTSWIGIDVRGTYGTGGAVGGNISNNVIIDGGTLNSSVNGIVLQTTTGSHTIVNNKIHGVDTGIWLQSGSDNNVVLDNYVTSFSANAVLDSGINNTVRLIGSSSSFRGALVNRTSDVSVPNFPSGTLVIPFQAEEYDTSGIWTPTPTTPNPTKLIVPTGVTRVRVKALITFFSNSTGFRQLDIKKNGADYVGRTKFTTQASNGAGSVLVAETPVLTVVAGNYFEVIAKQSSGAGLNITKNTWFAMEIVE